MNVILAAGMILLLTSCSSTHVSDDHHGHHQHHLNSVETSESVKASGRFTADKDLKVRMQKIQSTVEDLHNDNNVVNSAKVKNAGRDVEATVKDIFKTCKLEPAADAAIHPILANILDGASLLKRGHAKDGQERIHQALLKYEELFGM